MPRLLPGADRYRPRCSFQHLIALTGHLMAAYQKTEIVRDENRIAIHGRLSSFAIHWIVAKMREALQSGYNDVVFDFTANPHLFPDGLVPLAALVDCWSQDGVGFDIILPESTTSARLLENCNLAHFIRPDRYEYRNVLVPRHVAIRRFSDSSEQVAVVNEFMDVALKNTSLPRDILQGLEWSLNEIMDNVLIHAQASRGGFAQASTLEGHVAFTVADCGRGILASLREGYPRLERDVDAIGEAVKAGVTRNPEIGQGNGLAGSLRVATESGGSIIVNSGKGEFVAFRNETNTESRVKTYHPVQAYPGTIVTAQIRKVSTFKVLVALGFPGMVGGVLDIIENKYESEDGRTFLVSMKDETPGFGSRETGRQVRNKLRNLLAADPGKQLVINWEGVPLISSSFADESFGKLFAELGPLEFGARVRHIALESLVRGLLDKAIFQRAAQVASAIERGTIAEPPSAEEIPMGDNVGEQIDQSDFSAS